MLMDKDWFARNDFKRLQKHCNVDENSWSKQPRKKWRDVRKALGKVRRLSIPFLRDERIRLEYHRNAARAKVEANLKGQTLNKEEIEKLAAPAIAELIPIPEPFIVGQRVLAKHPSAKRAYVGSVLTVSKLNVRVQFDDPQLGSEQIKDIDVMGLGAEYDEALRVLSENAAIGDALERDEDRKMGLIFSKAKRRVSGMEKGLELAFMGKQFSLEDGVLSRENYGQVVLPDVKKEEPLSQATVEQMPIPPAEQRTPTRSSTRGGGGGEEEERQRGTNDSDTFAPRCEAEGRTNGRQQRLREYRRVARVESTPPCVRVRRNPTSCRGKEISRVD